MSSLSKVSKKIEEEFVESDIDSFRQKIEEEQNQFVDALFDNNLILSGFDQERFQVAASILKRKRIKALKKSWPGIEQSLGCDFKKYFFEYARSRSQPRYQSSLLDGRLFARYLKQQNLLGRDLEKIVKRFDQKFFVKGKRIYRRNKLQRLLFRLKEFFA